MVKKTTLTALLILVLGTAVLAQDKEPTLIENFSRSHQVGFRIGGWANLGGLPPDTPIVLNAEYLQSNVGNANIYFEAFFGYRLNQQLMLELSLGISNRGSVTLSGIGNTTNVGNVIIYPILLQMKLYPLSTTASRLQPYFFGGGGLYYGRRSTQISSSGYVSSLDYESKSVFHYAFGGGIDLPLGKSIAADFNVKYMPVTFTKQFVYNEDYKGLSITLGIKYLYSFKGKEVDREGRHR